MALTQGQRDELIATATVGFVIGLFLLLSGRASAADVPREAFRYRSELIRNARLVWGLDAPVATFAAQVHQESGWRPDARSAYAHGLAQFTPDTAEWIAGQDEALAGADTGNPVWALRALVRYDKWLYDRTAQAAGNTASACDRWWGTLRGYNGGLGHWLKEARLAAPSTDRGAIDAQCGRASRHAAHCRENLAYPRLILTKWQPLYASWGPGVKCG